LAIGVAACAKSPESISPSYISDVQYRGWTCDQLGQEEVRLVQALAVASQQQEKARSNDIVGVIFIGLPVSSLSGDNIAPEIARLKGENAALNRAMILNNCRAVPPAPVPPAASTPTNSG
jgi:hypothetical protein